MSKKNRQINIPCGDELYRAVANVADKNGTYVTTLVWVALAARYPELIEAIKEDRL
jgi:hypothetical protein